MADNQSQIQIPEELKNYTPAELHRFANQKDYLAGKTPATTLETLFEKAEKHDVEITLFPDGVVHIVRSEEDGSTSNRWCYSVAELGLALRTNPVFLDRPLKYKGTPCILKSEDEDEVVIEFPSGTIKVVYRYGLELALTNDREVYLEADFEAKEAEDDLKL